MFHQNDLAFRTDGCGGRRDFRTNRRDGLGVGNQQKRLGINKRRMTHGKKKNQKDDTDQAEKETPDPTPNREGRFHQLFATINTAGGRRLVDDDLSQTRQLRR